MRIQFNRAPRAAANGRLGRRGGLGSTNIELWWSTHKWYKFVQVQKTPPEINHFSLLIAVEVTFFWGGLDPSPPRLRLGLCWLCSHIWGGNDFCSFPKKSDLFWKRALSSWALSQKRVGNLRSLQVVSTAYVCANESVRQLNSYLEIPI